MTERLAIWSSRRPGVALALWGVALVAAISLTAAFLGDALSGDEELTNDPDSRRADALVDERFADERSGAGGESTEVVVVRSHRATVDEPAFRRRVETIAAELRAAGATAATTFYDTGESATGLGRTRRDGDPRRPRPRRRGPGRRRRRSGAGRRRPRGIRRHDHRRVHGRRRRVDSGGGGSAERRARIRVAGRADRPVDRLRLRRRGADPGPAVARLDHGRARADGARRTGLPALGLRHKHAHRDGAGARDRLLAVHPLPLPGGARSRAGEARCDRRDRRHGEPGGAVQRLRVHARDGRAPAGAEHGHEEPGRGRNRGGVGLGCRGADAPAGAAQPARRSRQRAADPLLREGRRPRAEPLLVADGASGDPTAGDQPRRLHGDPARDGRAGARPGVGPGGRQHAPRPARRQAGVSRPERGVPGRDHRPGGDRGRRRRHLAGRAGGNRSPAGASGERGSPRRRPAGDERRR